MSPGHIHESPEKAALAVYKTYFVEWLVPLSFLLIVGSALFSSSVGFYVTTAVVMSITFLLFFLAIVGTYGVVSQKISSSNSSEMKAARPHPAPAAR